MLYLFDVIAVVNENKVTKMLLNLVIVFCGVWTFDACFGRVTLCEIYLYFTNNFKQIQYLFSSSNIIIIIIITSSK